MSFQVNVLISDKGTTENDQRVLRENVLFIKTFISDLIALKLKRFTFSFVSVMEFDIPPIFVIVFQTHDCNLKLWNQFSLPVAILSFILTENVFSQFVQFAIRGCLSTSNHLKTWRQDGAACYSEFSLCLSLILILSLIISIIKGVFPRC